MLSPKLVELFFTSASLQRWNDYPRMIELVELDKQAHKFIIAYLLAKIENDPKIDMTKLIQAGIFEFLRRVVVTDIRPDIFRKILNKKRDELNKWVIQRLNSYLKPIENGKFLEEFEEYLLNENICKKERFILSAASYMATRWEFSIVYQTSQFLHDIDSVKNAVEEEIEDYYELIGIRKITLNQKLSKFIDLSGRLRFQKRWTQTPRIPETSVLGHMFIVALFSYFYSLTIKATPKRIQNNFFCALFHDLPEALTKDIITPVKYSVSGLHDIINEYEIQKIEDDILPLIPKNIQKEFRYLLGLYDENKKKDEFLDKIYEKQIQVVDNLRKYNQDKYNPIDGRALKACDRLAAFVEAELSISHGVKSNELINGSKETLEKLKDNPNINGVNFYELAYNIKRHLNSPQDTCGT